jgi:hypothetical protein
MIKSISGLVIDSLKYVSAPVTNAVDSVVNRTNVLLQPENGLFGKLRVSIETQNEIDRVKDLNRHKEQMKPVFDELKRKYDFDLATQAEQTFKRVCHKVDLIDKKTYILNNIKKKPFNECFENIPLNERLSVSSTFIYYRELKDMVELAVDHARKIPRPCRKDSGFDDIEIAKDLKQNLVQDYLKNKSLNGELLPYNSKSYKEAVKAFVRNLGLNQNDVGILTSFALLAEAIPNELAAAGIDDVIIYGVGAKLSTKVFWHLYEGQNVSRFLKDSVLELPNKGSSGFVGNGVLWTLYLKKAFLLLTSAGAAVLLHKGIDYLMVPSPPLPTPLPTTGLLEQVVSGVKATTEGMGRLSGAAMDGYSRGVSSELTGFKDILKTLKDVLKKE